MATSAASQEITIAAFGDSLTHGYGLAHSDGFVPQLQAWLKTKGEEVTLINAGVSGDTTAGGKSRIAWTLSEDVDALIVALGGNDVLRGLDPALSEANLDAILSEIGTRPVLLVGISAPGNYGPDYKAEFDAIYPRLAEKHGTLLYPDFLEALTRLDDPGKVLRDHMQPDGIHPNPSGVALIVEDMGPVVIDLLGQVRRLGK